LTSVQGIDSPPSRDPDDWFAESEWAGGPPPPRASTGDGEPVRRRRTPLADLTFTLRTLLVAALVVMVVIVVAGLAISGAFSSSSRHPTTSPPTTAPTTTNRNTTPTTTAATPQQRAAPTTTLKPGDTGAQVKLLQRALSHLGYAPGSVDGDYGPSTIAAVKKFQQASKLTADGIVGPATLRALKRALANS
jgi:Putative peptidoglycan binding domain